MPWDWEGERVTFSPGGLMSGARVSLSSRSPLPNGAESYRRTGVSYGGIGTSLRYGSNAPN